MTPAVCCQAGRGQAPRSVSSRRREGLFDDLDAVSGPPAQEHGLFVLDDAADGVHGPQDRGRRVRLQRRDDVHLGPAADSELRLVPVQPHVELHGSRFGMPSGEEADDPLLAVDLQQQEGYVVLGHGDLLSPVRSAPHHDRGLIQPRHGGHPLHRAEQGGEHGQLLDPHVPEGAGPLLVEPARVGGPVVDHGGAPVGDARTGPYHAAYGPLVQQPAQRYVRAHDGAGVFGDQLHAALVGRLDQTRGLPHGDRHGLLGVDVLARLEPLQGHGKVGLHGGQDDQELEGDLRQHLLHVHEVRDRKLLPGPPGPVLDHVADRCQLPAGCCQLPDVVEVAIAGDRSASCDRIAQPIHGL